MIEELRVSEFGGIKGELLFSPGLNVIIGESGTGKSLLLNSINFLKGKSFPFVKEGTFVEGVFRVNGEEITFRREFKSSRSRFFLNGMRVPQKRVSHLIGKLVLFQSQRLSQELLKPSYQLSLVDEFGRCKEKLKEYRELYLSYLKALKELQDLKSKLNQGEIDLLRFQISEIEEADLKEGEEEELLRLKELVSKAEEIRSLREKSLYLLSEGEVNASSLISEVLREFERSSLFPEIEKELEEVYYLLEGVVSRIEREIEVPETELSLSEIEERLYQIEKLKRKYGSSYSEIMDFLKRAKEELSRLERGEELIEEKDKKVKELRQELFKVGRELSSLRKEGAFRLKEFLKEEFKELGLEGAKFEVEFIKEKEPEPYGLERVNFLFSGNPKLPLSSLSESISGGELSRFLLSVLNYLSPGVSVMVFDEIDSGISGKILKKVAEKLKGISRKRQVIAVSHSPQVVAAADKVFKLYRKGEETLIKELKGEELLKELSVMISGKTSEASLKAAEDLIKDWEELWKATAEER